MRKIKNYNLSFFFVALLIFGVSFLRAESATIDFSPSTGSYNTGDTISVKIYINSESRSVNAVSANVNFSNDILSLSSVSKTGSIINIWAQEPSFSNINGTASFEGVILSGYNGTYGNIATLIFKVKKSGSASIRFSSASVLANDGAGTEVLSSFGSASIKIVTPVNLQEAKKETPTKKTETIKPDTTINTDSDIPDEFLNFTTIPLKIPTVTYFPNNLYTDDLLVLKGVADPSVDIEIIITNINTGAVIKDHVATNSDGKFTYIPEEKMPSGIYSIIMKSTSKDGISSEYMSPIQVINKEHNINLFADKINKYLSVLTPVVALVTLLIIVLMYSAYRIKKFNIYLKRRVSKAEDIVKKSFDILEEDFNEEIAIFKKIRENKILSKEEQAFLVTFKKDIKETEKVIKKELENIEKISK